MTTDTVFNREMRPVFVGSPEETHRRLKARHPDGWASVCVGETQQIVTITEYLHREKYTVVHKLVKEILRKKGLPVYQRDAALFDTHVERTVRKIVEVFSE